MQIVVPIWYSEGLDTMPEKKNPEPFLYLKQGWEECRDHSLHSLCFQVSFSIKEGTHLKMTIHITPNKFKCLNSVLSASHPLLSFQLIPTPLRHCQPCQCLLLYKAPEDYGSLPTISKITHLYSRATWQVIKGTERRWCLLGTSLESLWALSSSLPLLCCPEKASRKTWLVPG